jgi:predicted permease
VEADFRRHWDGVANVVILRSISMPIISRVRSLWRNLTLKEQVEADLHSEVEVYVEELTAEKVRRGMPPEAARRAALIETEGVEQVKEQVRDARTGALLEVTAQDVKYGWRMLRKNPGFTLAAIVALALGIGANTAIFSVVNAVLLRPLPYRNPDQLVVVLHGGNSPVAPANYLDWKKQSQTFQEMGAAEYWSPNLTGGDRPERVWALRLTASLFPVLGVNPLMGRVFGEADETTGRDQVVVISYGTWQRRFGGDKTIVGKYVSLDGSTYEVIGVMPPTFRFAPFWATKAELWVPLSLQERATMRRGNSLRIFGRMKDGVKLEQARAEIATITGRLEQQFPGTNRNVQVVSLKEKVVGDVRPALLVMLGAVMIVLLIACANVAHMLLARAAARRKEIAVRIALGATRARLVRQFITESVLLSLMAGICGLLLGRWGINVLLALHPAGLPYMDGITLDMKVLAFTVGVSIVTGLVFGIAPALHGTSVNLNASLKESERGTSETGGRSRFRSVLIASEFGLALVLLVGAGLMIRAFMTLTAMDPGFNPSHLLTMTVSVTGTQQSDPTRRMNFFSDVVTNVKSVAGVESASMTNHIPLAGDTWGYSFYVQGRPMPRPGDSPKAIYRVVMPGYFQAMEVPFLRGRDVTNGDTVGRPGVVVINQFLAEKWFPNEDAVGKQITLDDPSEGTPSWMKIVGVVKNLKQQDWADPPYAEMFLPYYQTRSYLEDTQSRVNYMTLVARTKGDPSDAVATVQNAIWSLDKNVTIAEVRTMDDIVENANSQPRFYLVLLGSFAAVALLLAAVGMYGVMSYAVAQRTHEIGIRMALGASQGDVLRMVVRQGVVLALTGAVVGLVGSLLSTRLMVSFLYGVQPRDPLTIAFVWVVLTSVALLACYIPARRATRVDPIVALRYE